MMRFKHVPIAVGETDDKAAAAGDLRVGDRVVVDVGGDEANLTATEVRFAPARLHATDQGTRHQAEH